MDMENTEYYLKNILIELEWISRGGREKYTIYDPVDDYNYYVVKCVDCGSARYDMKVREYSDLEIDECDVHVLEPALKNKRGLLECMTCSEKVLLENSDKNFNYEPICYFCDKCRNSPEKSEYIKNEEETYKRRNGILKNKGNNSSNFIS